MSAKLLFGGRTQVWANDAAYLHLRRVLKQASRHRILLVATCSHHRIYDFTEVLQRSLWGCLQIAGDYRC